MAVPEGHRVLPADESELPSWFRYPRPFLRVLEAGLVRFPPWKILDGPASLRYRVGLKERFPARELFPFALRTDCDDVACWEEGYLDRVDVIHDFASPGWEQEAAFATFWEWLRSAIDDFIAFDS